MNYILENDYLKVAVRPEGYEIRDVFVKSDNSHRMFMGNPDNSDMVGPVLFPYIGRCKNDKITHNGKIYPAPMHGFLYTNKFKLKERSKDFVSFVLTDTEETLKLYPYRFIFEIEYYLIENTVKEVFKVTNVNDETMYFSLGAHPTFISPFGDNSLVDYQINFNTDKIIYKLLDSNGCVLNDCHDLILNDKKYTIKSDSFDKDAFIIENDQTDEISLIKDNSTILTVKSDCPVWGIWSIAGQNVPFICIEPWFGRADSVDFSGELKDREWTNVLESGDTLTKSFYMTFT